MSKLLTDSEGYWLIKFAPFRTSWSEIVRRGTFTLRGVRSFQARNTLNAMQIGEPVLFYHSQRELAVVGLLEVSRAAYPDPTSADNKWLTCDFIPIKSFTKPVSLALMKTMPELANLPLIRQPRLAVMPLTKIEFETITKGRI
jgi:predicted RNA-binding protein with PUA-like domain